MQRIAIIGSGISGITAYNLLNKHPDFEVSLFEKENYLGGHTLSVPLPHPWQTTFVDLGFMVFNNKTYPILLDFFKTLNIRYAPTEMSFSVKDQFRDLEYNGHTFLSLFNRKNIFSIEFYRMLYDIIRFNIIAKSILSKKPECLISLRAFLTRYQFGNLFSECYLKPMVSSIWSSDEETVNQFPIAFLFSFMHNHGLLNIINRPQWYQVTNGAHHYVKAITKDNDNIHLNTSIKSIFSHRNEVIISTANSELKFDKVILATHADTSLSLLKKPSEIQRKVLRCFTYSQNEVTLHQDASLMPKYKRSWASWNFLQNADGRCTLTYYLNRLQNLDIREDFFVSLNSKNAINPDKIILSKTMSHPVFTKKAIAAQQQFHAINESNIFFCGAYWRNGFHEDGAWSAHEVCKQIGAL